MHKTNQFLSALFLLFVALTANAEVVNINTATADQLAAALKGVGAKQATAIVDYREQNGSFRSADDLTNVPGIGAKTIEKNKSSIALNDMDKPASAEIEQVAAMEQTPPDMMRDADVGGLININTATAEELQILINVGPAKAARIIEYRQQNGPFGTVDDLAKVSGIGPRTLEKNKASLTVN